MFTQLTLNFDAPAAPPSPPKRRNPKKSRTAEADAEKSRNDAYWAAQREHERLEARAYWKVGMVVSMPLWAKVLDAAQTYTQMLPGVVEAITGDQACVRIYAAPEYGCWMEDYPLHRKLAVDVPLVDLGRYALNEHLGRIAAEGKLGTGDADLAERVRAHRLDGFKGPRP